MRLHPIHIAFCLLHFDRSIVEVKMSRTFFVFVSLILALLAIQTNALEHEVEENQLFSIQCAPNQAINIKSAVWTYNQAKVENYFTLNIRNFVFLWGKHVGICKYDVQRFLNARCNFQHRCSFTALRETFGDCGYDMFLKVEYECNSGFSNSLTVSKDLNCVKVKDYDENLRKYNYCFATSSRRRRSSINSYLIDYCTRHMGLTAIAESLERNPAFHTRQVNNMNAITQITTREFPHQNGNHVDLVYVMRARITANTLQAREPYPPGVDQRMRELDAITSGSSRDDRGHLLASTLGGPRDVLNIAPQFEGLNRVNVRGGFSFWRRMEEFIRDRIQNNNAAYVLWTLVVNYADLQNDNLRPTGFGLQFTVYYADGRVSPSGDLYFTNEQDNCAWNYFDTNPMDRPHSH